MLHWKVRDFTLNFKHCWGYSIFCQISGSTCYLKWSLYERQPPGCRLRPLNMVVEWASASGDPAAECWSCMRYFFSVSKLQPMTMQIQNCCSTKFALDLNSGSGNLTEVNKIAALIDHCACANDNGAAYVNTPPVRSLCHLPLTAQLVSRLQGTWFLTPLTEWPTH